MRGYKEERLHVHPGRKRRLLLAIQRKGIHMYTGGRAMRRSRRSVTESGRRFAFLEDLVAQLYWESGRVRAFCNHCEGLDECGER
jgi:hypothetical protein